MKSGTFLTKKIGRNIQTCGNFTSKLPHKTPPPGKGGPNFLGHTTKISCPKSMFFGVENMGGMGV